MRLIDADLITEVLKKELARDDCRGFWNSTVNSLIKIIEAAPTVKITTSVVPNERTEE